MAAVCFEDGSGPTFRIGREEEGERLDVAVVRGLAGLPGVTRARVRRWVDEGLVRVNGLAAVKVSRRLADGDQVTVVIEEMAPRPPRTSPTAAEMPLAVAFEDDWLLALDKPPGVVAHPTPRRAEGTLLNGLLWRAREWGEGRQPHLVSRLDRDTSGLLLVAKAPDVHAALQRSRPEKDYLAVVYGRAPGDKGRVDLGIVTDPADRRRTASRTGGAPSTTLWERLDEASGEPLSLLRCRLLTGRTHQIRVHLQAVRLPLVGDPLYGAPGWKGIADPALAEACRAFPRQALHAWRLSLRHPVTGERLDLVAPPPSDLAILFSQANLKL